MKIFLFLTFFCFSFSVFSQKSEQVKNYLGEANYFATPSKGEVIFSFQKGQLMRKSDGVKSFAQLLKEAPGYSDSDNAGKLLSIESNGVKVQSMVRASVAVVPESARPFSLPDSISLVDKAEEIKRKATFWESQMWAAIRPLWSVLMHFFWILFPIMIAIMGALWFWAKLSASEEFSGLHYKTSKALTLAVGGTWTVFLINGILTIIGMEMGIVATVFCSAILAAIAYNSAAWIIPNYKQKLGGRPNPNFNSRQLNG